MKFKLGLLAALAAGMFGVTGAHAQSYAISNARIITVSGAAIDRGTVVIRDGLIEAVGANITPPADAKVFDAGGATVYPGFFDAGTNLGIQAPQRPAPGPGGQAGQAGQAAQSTPSISNYPEGLRPEDVIALELSATESQFESARNAGFTTALTTGRTGIFNGQSAVINLAGDSVGAMIVKSPAALHISFATISGRYPGSLLGMMSATRQLFYDARRHQELQRMYEADPRGLRRPAADLSLEALIPALDRRMPVVFHANREMEIVRALELAKEFNLRTIILGGQESGKVIDRLKAANASVIFSMNLPKRTTAASPDADPEPLETLRFRAEAPKTAGLLRSADIPFAFHSGGLTNMADFFTNAGIVVQGGLSRDALIRGLTLGAAEIFGIADRTGSIDAGKIANLAVVRGDLFDRTRTVTHVFVDGKLFEPKVPATPAAGTPGTTPAAIGGRYTITVDVPGQPMPGTLVLTPQPGNVLTGSLETALGPATARDGKVTGNNFEFTTTVILEGQEMVIFVRGSVTGNTVSGTVESPQGTVPFSGTKIP
ncbi:MAG TPA: amidohydrolase family protein [Pyrinomonadaceae bacterium]|nr:amidohydrolase family protein [Pyrinomonadaceae bacterium]